MYLSMNGGVPSLWAALTSQDGTPESKCFAHVDEGEVQPLLLLPLFLYDCFD